MQINVSQLLREPIGSTRDYQVDDMADIGGDGVPRPVRGEVRLLRTQRSILARCTLSTDVELTCSRCLSTFHYPVAQKFDEEYLPTVDATSGMPLPRPEDGSVFTIDGNHVLDLAEAIRQYTLLAIPMKPLCTEGCAGLCPHCGHNLNRGRCDCPVEDPDPRWSVLTELL